MAKDVYKIPDTLDKSVGDTEIALKTSDGIGLRPVPIKIVMCYVCSFMVGFYVISKSFISSGSLWLIALFAAFWAGMSVLLFKRDKTGIPQYSLLVSMVNYLPKSMRNVFTRKDSLASDFYGILGIVSIDEKHGLITFTDGTFGFMYKVVGSGSVLLFDADRIAILDRVDRFYRKIDPECQMIFITSKEAQDVAKQAGALNARFNNLQVDDPDLKAMAMTQLEYLRNWVGKRHRSIHQYMILKADNTEMLIRAKHMLEGEVAASMFVFKQCRALSHGEEIYSVFHNIYSSKR